jgi:magnesium transporter
MRRATLALRRAIWPTRDMVNALIRDDSPLIASGTKVFLRDCYDHTIQLMDVVETFREIAADLIDVYMSSVSARMNEVMKMLTVIATIFIPLGFVASVYGMNFDTQRSPWNMPELAWTYGYPAVLGLMAAVAGGLLVYFWRRGWIGRGPTR